MQCQSIIHSTLTNSHHWPDENTDVKNVGQALSCESGFGSFHSYNRTSSLSYGFLSRLASFINFRSHFLPGSDWQDKDKQFCERKKITVRSGNFERLGTIFNSELNLYSYFTTKNQICQIGVGDCDE